MGVSSKRGKESLRLLQLYPPRDRLGCIRGVEEKQEQPQDKTNREENDGFSDSKRTEIGVELRASGLPRPLK